MRKLFLMLLALCMLAMFAFTGCDGSGGSDPVDPPVPGEPDFVLTTQDKDAVDAFAVPGLGLGYWNDSPCPIVVLVKNATATGNHYKKCDLNDYCEKNNGIMRPATFLFSANSAPFFTIQIECICEEQGLCCAKFSSSYISEALRSKYVGEWDVKIGKASEYHQTDSDNDDYVDNVLYEACVEISSGSGSGVAVKTKEETPEFVLTTLGRDAIDTFAVPGIVDWTASSLNCPIVVLAKHPTATGGYYKKCVFDGYWAKDNKRPQTFHFNATSFFPFKMQVQCLNQEQGLCCIKFTTMYITSFGGSYTGEWDFIIGKTSEYHSMTSGADDYVDTVLYEASVTIE